MIAASWPVLGVMDVGGSHVEAAVVGVGDRRVVSRARGAVDSGAGRTEVLDDIAAPGRGLRPPADAWTIALPGPFDYERGVGGFEGVGKFASIAGVDLALELGVRLGVPPDRVRFLNDAAAFAIGEWAARSPRPDRMLAVTLGTGVGSAFIDRGCVVDRGPDVPPHGWAHLIRLDGAPLEQRVSTAAISSAWRTISGDDRSVRRIATLAREGDARARELLRDTMHALGRALAPWVRRFGAECVVVGGAIARSWDVIAPGIGEGLAEAEPTLDRVRVVPAELGDDAPLLGAAEWSLR